MFFIECYLLFLGPTVLSSTTTVSNGSGGTTVTAGTLPTVSTSLSQSAYPGILATNYAAVSIHLCRRFSEMKQNTNTVTLFITRNKSS